MFNFRSLDFPFLERSVVQGKWIPMILCDIAVFVEKDVRDIQGLVVAVRHEVGQIWRLTVEAQNFADFDRHL